MMNERFIHLVQKKLDNEITQPEQSELDQMLESNKQLIIEYEKQFKAKEALNNMSLKNPSSEVWDSYWVKVYNRFERGIAWLIVTFGAVIILGYAAYSTAEKLLSDTHSPIILKIGITLIFLGIFFLFFSVIREKYFTRKYDKYKEIQR